MNGARMTDTVCNHDAPQPQQSQRQRHTDIAPLYEAICWELRKQKIALGLTDAQCEEISGLESGYLGKMLHEDTPSGRQAGWRACPVPHRCPVSWRIYSDDPSSTSAARNTRKSGASTGDGLETWRGKD